MIINDDWIVTTGFEEPEEKVKSTKDKTIEHAMKQVNGALSGKNFRRILGAIEQQIRYAYQRGYEIGQLENDFSKERYEAGYKDGMNHQRDHFNDLLAARYATGFEDGYNKGRDEGKVALREWKRKITEVVNDNE